MKNIEDIIDDSLLNLNNAELDSNNSSRYRVITDKIMRDSNILPVEKIFFGEIVSLCQKQGYCWAENKYFATLFNTNPRTINRWLVKLIANNYIKREFIYKKDSKEILYRKLHLIDNILIPIIKKPIDTVCQWGMTLVSRGDDTRVNTNNIHINSTNTITKDNSVREENSRRRKRGTRIPPQFSISEIDKIRLKEKYPLIDIDDEFDTFHNYWLAKAGPGSEKLDWVATFRNWIKKAEKFRLEKIEKEKNKNGVKSKHGSTAALYAKLSGKNRINNT